MKRLFGTLIAAALVVALPVVTHAQDKTMNATGTVSAVTAASMTVKARTGTDTWSFVIDKDTSVTAKGATHKSLELKADGKAARLTDFVKVGDSVSVSYHDMGAMKHAAVINVTAAAPPK